ncbi:DUF1684 domain-containing protein [Taibaiella koreensis]|uniref:DUF1684 domain-containing protein n=1 Tax=Taibaiella koreensis TaxID=1268548 RepID=UPI000E59AB47|nr:DUF1684 domain-containing protein [Taibaiella koreensis]
MKGILFCILCLPGFGALAQKNYKDSLQEHRRQYTADLYPIIKDDTAFLSFFPANRQMVVTATVEQLTNEKPFKLTTSSGKTKEAQKYALLRFSLNGKPYQLYAYQLLALKEKAETANELFLPFIDPTCGKESYGGGRYIDLQLTDIHEGRIVIDFNKAYNPYCAFTTGYNCPIPPRENSLPVAIKAGERYRPAHFKH